jgi:DNA replicative helicase MCM subunit Mcm2 (Cdc46/Mcm family)
MVADFSPRAVYTSGKASSAAGIINISVNLVYGFWSFCLQEQLKVKNNYTSPTSAIFEITLKIQVVRKIKFMSLKSLYTAPVLVY